MFLWVYMYIYIYIYTISNQHFKAFTVSTVATSTGLCATCTCQETRISFCVLTCTRASFPVRENSPSCGYSGQKTLQKRLSKQASFLAGGGGSRDQFISMHGMFECEQYWNQIYTCVSLRSVMHSKYRIMPPPLPSIHALFTKSAPCF